MVYPYIIRVQKTVEEKVKERVEIEEDGSNIVNGVLGLIPTIMAYIIAGKIRPKIITKKCPKRE